MPSNPHLAGMDKTTSASQSWCIASLVPSCVGTYVRFSLPKADEWLDITCEVPSRAVFAQGALQAAKFLEDRPAGLYDMDDVLRS